MARSLGRVDLSQALAVAGERLTELATGDPFDLNAFEMPAADAIAYVAAHPGEGHYLLRAIDPSAIEEGDPLSCNPELDLYEPANGFAEPPAPSKFSDDFLKRYRAAQGLRVERLDRSARERIRLRNVARAAARETGSAADRRAATATDFMLIYRTDADPRYVDPSIDPSGRDYGYTGDNAIFPSDTQHIVDSLGSEEIVRKSIPGDHYGFPAETGRDAAVEEVIAWLRKTG